MIGNRTSFNQPEDISCPQCLSSNPQLSVSVRSNGIAEGRWSEAGIFTLRTFQKGKGVNSVKKIVIRKTEAVKLTSKSHPVHGCGGSL